MHINLLSAVCIAEISLIAEKLKSSVLCSLLALSRLSQFREVNSSVLVFSYMTKMIQKCENEREV